MRIFRLRLILLATLTFALTMPLAADAQGCSMCRDATAGSAPQTQRAFRRAIPLLGIPAVVVFAGALLLIRRVEPASTSEASYVVENNSSSVSKPNNN
jgi:hypothetical protein